MASPVMLQHGEGQVLQQGGGAVAGDGSDLDSNHSGLAGIVATASSVRQGRFDEVSTVDRGGGFGSGFLTKKMSFSLKFERKEWIYTRVGLLNEIWS
ncbi:hypothetical protein Syun_001537 [Stephania yunnanensis]|uniref:Uncharacterized protein n=1 Tax=Stephania yunnanensis TaxID=152371 RepID=A0AAP0LFV9_9MAGN